MMKSTLALSGMSKCSIQAPRSAKSVAHRAAPLRTTNGVGRRGLAVQAFALPPLLPLVARCITAGTLFYASMNYVAYRGARKDVEKYLEEEKSKSADRRSKVDKLTRGKAEDDKN